MTLLRFALLPVFLLAAVAPNLGQQVPQYRNSALPIEARVKDLLQRMTLEEKVAQLESTWQNHGQDQPRDLGQSSVVYAAGYEWENESRTTLGAKYAATYFNGLEKRLPVMTYIDVTPLQENTPTLIHCTSDMSDACLNAGDLRFDATGDFLFVSEVVRNRMRVLRVDAAAKTLNDTGSFFPFTSSAGVYFSPDDKLVYAIATKAHRYTS